MRVKASIFFVLIASRLAVITFAFGLPTTWTINCKKISVIFSFILLKYMNFLHTNYILIFSLPRSLAAFWIIWFIDFIESVTFSFVEQRIWCCVIRALFTSFNCIYHFLIPFLKNKLWLFLYYILKLELKS